MMDNPKLDVEQEFPLLRDILSTESPSIDQQDNSHYLTILPNIQEQPESLSNRPSEIKVFFITNCGSLLGRTIAQVALDRGHCVAACAREKHLQDLQAFFERSFNLIVVPR